MAEQPVFWLGGAPGSKKEKEGPAEPEAARYEPAIRDACESCGYELDEYVSALGGFGGWLAHLERDRQRYRIFWSGKDKQMKFEVARPNGGWDELAEATTEDTGVAGFVMALQSLLAAEDGQDARG